jgi:predicted RecB family endonuclease
MSIKSIRDYTRILRIRINLILIRDKIVQKLLELIQSQKAEDLEELDFLEAILVKRSFENKASKQLQILQMLTNSLMIIFLK